MAVKAEQQYDSQRSEAELHFASLKRLLASDDAAFGEPEEGVVGGVTVEA
jgi:hypothetical protein